MLLLQGVVSAMLFNGMPLKHERGLARRLRWLLSIQCLRGAFRWALSMLAKFAMRLRQQLNRSTNLCPCVG